MATGHNCLLTPSKLPYLQDKTLANFCFNIFVIKVRGFTTNLTLNESKDVYGAQLPADPFKTPLIAGQNSRDNSNLHFLSSKSALSPQMP